MSEHDEIYLGDGLYARFLGGEVRLRAPRGHEDHVVYLDRWMMQKLIEAARNDGMELK